MDVLVLLPDTTTYHLRRGRLPPHRNWPTRTPPNEIRVDDGTRGRVPHQVAPPSASPAEPSPGHESAGRRRGRVDGEDAGRASSTTNTSYMPAKSIFLMIGF